MKTDLSKILSVSGQHGLFRYVAQARNGIIAESLSDKKRTSFDMKSRMTSLADISIFTEDGELKLQEVFTKIAGVLDSKNGPTSKSSEKELVDLFKKAVPDYDGSRFYVSHMKKIADWYNDLVSFASLDFATEEEEQKDER